MQSYLELDSHSLLYVPFVYIDTRDYLADKLFLSEQLTVTYEKREYSKDDIPYVVIFCKIRKKEKKKFIRTMKQLERKVLFAGFSDYPEFCANLLHKFYGENP